jgi:hypothetical protein
MNFDMQKSAQEYCQGKVKEFAILSLTECACMASTNSMMCKKLHRNEGSVK